MRFQNENSGTIWTATNITLSLHPSNSLRSRRINGRGWGRKRIWGKNGGVVGGGGEEEEERFPS